MFPLSRNFLKFAAAGAFLALTVSGSPAHADEMAQNLGPVGAHEPILTTVGNKRVIAFYEPDNRQCAVNAVVYDKTDADTGMTAAAPGSGQSKPRPDCIHRQRREQVAHPKVR